MSYAASSADQSNMTAGSVQVLSLSDKAVSFIYSPLVRARFEGTGLIAGCGDLDYGYMEYVYTILGAPLVFVRGNHDKVVEYREHGQRTAPAGGVDLHRRTIMIAGLLLAGVEGSLRYRPGMFQYTQGEMFGHVLALVPGLLRNRLRYGRYLDILVTHAPPAGIHDLPDLPHQGIKAFRWLLDVFRPAYHIHGHVHLYNPISPVETIYKGTTVINTYGYQVTEVAVPWR